eukprot:751544-Hanusia_phi.AAC.1
MNKAAIQVAIDTDTPVYCPFCLPIAPEFEIMSFHSNFWVYVTSPQRARQHITTPHLIRTMYPYHQPQPKEPTPHLPTNSLCLPPLSLHGHEVPGF